MLTAVSAVLTGVEQFEVRIIVSTSETPVKYDCMENEDVDPVVWECTALPAQ